MNLRNTSLFLSISVIILIAVSNYWYSEIRKRDALLSMSEIDRSVSIIGKNMDLPTDEDPVLLTITNPEKLDQDIFPGQLLSGDELLVYRKSSRVIAYRPSTKKIINSASLPQITNESDAIGALGAGLNTPLLPTLALYISTSDAALVATVEAIISKQFPDIVINIRKDSQLHQYRGITLYDLSNGNQSDLVSKVAQAIGAQLELNVPLGERVPQSDMLIIVSSP